MKAELKMAQNSKFPTIDSFSTIFLPRVAVILVKGILMIFDMHKTKKKFCEPTSETLIQGTWAELDIT